MSKIIEFNHKLQLSRAQAYIRNNLSSVITLEDLARESGASRYHFIRVFNACTGETPFEFIRRQRILNSLQKLQIKNLSVTDIAFAVGFESSSSFNKAFKKLLSITPTEFRNLGKEEGEKIYYSLFETKHIKEIIMNLNFSEKPEVVLRKETVAFIQTKVGGEFKEIAPAVWSDFTTTLGRAREEGQDLSKSEYFGISSVEQKDDGEVINTYSAAISSPVGSGVSIDSLEKVVLPELKYAKFLLTGSYDGLWLAFEKAFNSLNEGGYELAEGPCLENYLNDPTITPEAELLTEVLIPIK